MPRVRELSDAHLNEQDKKVYHKFSRDYGPFENQVRIFAHRPPALRHIMGLLLDLSEENNLEKRYLEIALVTVSKLNECNYCVAHHAPRMVIHGFKTESSEKILEATVPGFNEVDKLVRDYAVQVTKTPQRISNEFFAKLRQYFSDAQIVELTLRIALCGFFNRFNDALQIEVEDSVARAL